MTTPLESLPAPSVTPAEYGDALTKFLRTDPRVEPYLGYRPESFEEAASHLRGVQRLLCEEGWARLGWPERFGGLGGDPRLRAAMFECLWNADIVIPEPYSLLEVLVPVLMIYAPELAREHFLPLLRGEENWCEGFSEPDAGSDLASLRTRMEPDGAGWRVTGQKIWTSNGHLSRRSVLLARSGEPGHRGLSMVLIDLDQPGVEVRPIRTESGEQHFSEMFFDGAWLPGDRVIGRLGQGWEIAMYMLQWERGAYGWLQQGRLHNRLGLALSAAADGAGERTGVARALGSAYAAAAALRMRTRNTVERLARDETLGPEVAIDKLLLVDAEVATWDVVRELYGPSFDVEPDLEWLRAEFLFSRAAPIYGGSQEIQRTLVAERVLGMPRTR
ncbi:MAG: acyl-CoA dehydrogenase family protein [Acidobacteriota bacterium]|nr:acyl-CoA dehydrogenase family protein [Acidobacteriota bacterium]